MSKTDAEPREQMLQAIMAQGHDREEAELVMARVADRLAGYTHEEVVAMHPPLAALDSESEGAA